MVSVGLTRALRDTGAAVIPFKKGPDYIDAGWLTAAAQSPCYNLDPYLMSAETVRYSFFSHLHGADYGVVEGNRGIYDGVDYQGHYSTAALAKELDLPVLLVVNCSKTTRTIGALVLGCCAFDPDVRFAGVILNQIATSRHETIIRQTLEHYTPLPVLGIVPRMREDIFPMRHLGLTPQQEYCNADAAVNKLAELARSEFELEAITAAMARVQTAAPPAPKVDTTASPLVIGVLRDMAFQFYYEENLEMLQRDGARLVAIDALSAECLPEELDALYIGGGFPETSARQLAENVTFRASVRQQAEAGLPIYAECGGLIYLGRSICIDDREYPLANVFPIVFGLAKKPQAHGYSAFTVEAENSFYPVGTRVKGHEFRYSTIKEWSGEPAELVLKMERGAGFIQGRDGLKKKNVLAMYTHVLAPGSPEWSMGLLAAARSYKKNKSSF